MVVSNVSGHFRTFACTVETDNDELTTAKAHFTADVDSIDTNNAQRDGHLKTGDFFDIANHPQIIFDSTGVEKVSDEEYKLHGNLTIRGNTHAVTFKLEYGGTVKDPWGNTRLGFVVEGKIKRMDYGLSWSAVTDAGGLVVADEIKLTVHAEFTKPQ